MTWSVQIVKVKWTDISIIYRHLIDFLHLHVVKMVQDWRKNLRDQFSQKSQRSGSGGEGVDEQAEQWRFYDRMSWMKPFLFTRRLVKTILCTPQITVIFGQTINVITNILWYYSGHSRSSVLFRHMLTNLYMYCVGRYLSWNHHSKQLLYRHCMLFSL